MPTKHEATDAAGKVWKRTSKTRVYSHCVVIHTPATLPTELWPNGWPASSKAEWASTLTNAQNNARRWQRGRDGIAVEILEARIVGSK